MMIENVGFGGTEYSREASGTHVLSFDDFSRAVNTLPHDQIDGNPSAYDALGAEYITINSKMLARKADVDVIGGQACRNAYWTLCEIIDNEMIERKAGGKRGTVHWRKRPSFEVNDCPIVVSYSDDGKDVCPLTDKKCTIDKDWIIVGIYARVSFHAQEDVMKMPYADMSPMLAELTEKAKNAAAVLSAIEKTS